MANKDPLTWNMNKIFHPINTTAYYQTLGEVPVALVPEKLKKHKMQTF